VDNRSRGDKGLMSRTRVASAQSRAALNDTGLQKRHRSSSSIDERRAFRGSVRAICNAPNSIFRTEYDRKEKLAVAALTRASTLPFALLGHLHWRRRSCQCDTSAKIRGFDEFCECGLLE
jgi:hypothetical protein